MVEPPSAGGLYTTLYATLDSGQSPARALGHS